jgi:hypothetical protein
MMLNLGNGKGLVDLMHRDMPHFSHLHLPNLNKQIKFTKYNRYMSLRSNPQSLGLSCSSQLMLHHKCILTISESEDYLPQPRYINSSLPQPNIFSSTYALRDGNPFCSLATSNGSLILPVLSLYICLECQYKRASIRRAKRGNGMSTSGARRWSVQEWRVGRRRVCRIEGKG